MIPVMGLAVKHLQGGFIMTVTECAQRILANNWEGVNEIDIKTLGYALIIVEKYGK